MTFLKFCDWGDKKLWSLNGLDTESKQVNNKPVDGQEQECSHKGGLPAEAQVNMDAKKAYSWSVKMLAKFLKGHNFSN